MTLDEYQGKINDFRLPSYTPEAAVMGLLSESGEVAGVFQKLMRGDFPPEIATAKLYAELGDILWHCAAIANDNGWKLEDIIEANVGKLESRKIRSQILGAGDDR